MNLSRYATASFLALSVGALAQTVPPAVKRVEASVDAEKIRAHVKYLADDSLEGRGPGTHGGEMAADYIAKQFASYGLKPAGDNGTYLQQVNFVGTKTVGDRTHVSLMPHNSHIFAFHAYDLSYGNDYTVSNRKLTEKVDIDAPIVFVGYGVVAPEFGWDDYAGVDVKGKVILCIVGDPPSTDPKFFGGKALTYYGRWTYKFEEAARHRAIGALIIHRTDLASYGWDVVKNSNTSEKTYLRDNKDPQLAAASWIQLEVARRLVDAADCPYCTVVTVSKDHTLLRKGKPISLSVWIKSLKNPIEQPALHVEEGIPQSDVQEVIDAVRKTGNAAPRILDNSADKMIEAAGHRGFKAVELPISFRAHIESKVRSFQSPNVVAMIPGMLPNTPGFTGSPRNSTSYKRSVDQAVIYTAHYDHLGMVPGMAGDNIYNGAADNATGCGMLLELARAWSTLKTPPPHTIIFASVAAEEQGLLGSEYLGQHPPVPPAQIALDINYDMILPIGIPLEVNLNGAQRTTFNSTVLATAKRFNLTVVPDSHPEAGGYYRSDHFSLSRVGIPAFSVDQGELFEGHDRAWGQAKDKAFVENDYHNFSDNYHADWDFKGNAKLVRFGIDLGWEAISAPKIIEWLPGDEFEAARKASAK